MHKITIKRLSMLVFFVMFYMLISIGIFIASSQEVLAAQTPIPVQEASVDAANKQNTYIVEEVVGGFVNNSKIWANKLESAVKDLFKLFFTLELVILGITAVIKRDSLEDIFSNLMMSTLVGAIVYICIVNYQPWSEAIMMGLSEYVGLLGYDDSKNFIISPVEFGLDIFKIIVGKLSMWSPIDSLGFALCAIAILLCFAFVTIQIIYIKCEAFVAVGAAFILLGFGGCKFFREYATNVMRYTISVGFKLYVLYIVLGLGFSFMRDKILIPDQLSYEGLGILLVTSLILLALTKALPDVAAGIIQGAQVNTGGNMMSTVYKTAAMAAGATALSMRGAGKASSTLQDIKQASGVASATGVGGLVGTAKTYWQARQMANAENNLSPVRSKLEYIQAQHSFDNSASSSSPPAATANPAPTQAPASSANVSSSAPVREATTLNKKNDTPKGNKS